MIHAKPGVDEVPELGCFAEEFIGLGDGHGVTDVVADEVSLLSAAIEVGDEVRRSGAEGGFERKERIVVATTSLLDAKARSANSSDCVESRGVVGQLEAPGGREAGN